MRDLLNRKASSSRQAVSRDPSSLNMDPPLTPAGDDGKGTRSAYRVTFVALCLFAASAALAADRYVRQGATGSGNGSDWTNAYTSLPASLVRGDTYYVADGTYAGYTFDD